MKEDFSEKEGDIQKGTGINPEDIEGIIIEGIEKGHIELAGIKDGDIAFSITPSGEQRVADLAGGRDVLDISGAWLELLVKHGARGFPVQSTVTQFLIISVLVQAFKNYGTWDNFSEISKKT